MQTESVSSRDLSSPEGLGGNQTEYLRQASLIPLVRPKSHVRAHKLHTDTGTHMHAPTHHSDTKERESRKKKRREGVFRGKVPLK